MKNDLNPTILQNLDQYTYRTRGHCAEIFTDSEGVALKLYEKRYETDAAHFEYEVLKYLKTKQISCPQLIDSVQFQDRWGVRYLWIEGERFRDRFTHRFWKPKKIAQLFSRLHSEIHKIEGCEFLMNQREYYHDALANEPNLSKEDKTRLLDLLTKIPVQNSLCHGDFNDKNTLINQNTGYVIDWQNTYMGDPLGDIAQTWVKLSFYAFHSNRTNYLQKLWLRKFCRCYLNEYSKKNKIKMSELFQWIAIAAGHQIRTLKKPEQYWYQHLINTYFTALPRLEKYVTG